MSRKEKIPFCHLVGIKPSELLLRAFTRVWNNKLVISTLESDKKQQLNSQSEDSIFKQAA